jgi:hypothetical protein
MLSENSTKLFLMLAAGGVLAGVTWWRPMIGLFIYLASVGLDYLIGVVGFNTGGIFSIGQGMLMLLVAVSGIRLWTSKSTVSPPARRLFGCLVFFAVAVWLSVFFGVWPANSAYPAAVISALLFVPFVFYVLVDTAGRLRWFLWAIGLGSVLSALIGTLQFSGVLQATAESDMDSVEDARGAVREYQGINKQQNQGTRYAGPTKNPNAFGDVLMGGIPALFFLMATSRKLPARLLALSGLGACAFALLLSMSRTYIIAFLVFLALMAVFLHRGGLLQRVLLLFTALLIGAAFTFMILNTEGVGERISAGFRDGGDTSTQARTAVLQGGVMAWLDFPFCGIGLNNTSPANYNGNGNASHDIISTLLGEMGTIGFVAFALLVIQAFKTVSTDGEPESCPKIGLLVRSVIFICLLSGSGDTVVFGRSLWIWLGLGAILSRLHSPPPPAAELPDLTGDLC